MGKNLMLYNAYLASIMPHLFHVRLEKVKSDDVFKDLGCLFLLTKLCVASYSLSCYDLLNLLNFLNAIKYVLKYQDCPTCCCCRNGISG